MYPAPISVLLTIHYRLSKHALGLERRCRRLAKRGPFIAEVHPHSIVGTSARRAVGLQENIGAICQEPHCPHGPFCGRCARLASEQVETELFSGSINAHCCHWQVLGLCVCKALVKSFRAQLSDDLAPGILDLVSSPSFPHRSALKV